MAYTKYSLTPANNNAAPPDGAPEGMLPSAVNDTMRDMMAQIRDVGDGIRGGTYTMTAPVITGGSITGVALSGNTLTSPVITGGSINNTPIGASTANTGAFTTLGATGVATFSAGTVSAPAITTTGDTNTGIFFPAADTIAFTEGGVEAMRIDASGRLGIGTASPGYLLDIQKPSFAQLRLYSTDNSTSAQLVLGSSTGASTASQFIYYDNSLVLAQAGVTERMTIDSSGNVGIGTSSPASKLHVSQTYSAPSGGISADTTGLFTKSNTANGNCNISILSRGTGFSRIYFGSDAIENAGAIEVAGGSASGAGSMRFYTNDGTVAGTERMRITSTGQVGINCTPSTTLQVSEPANLDATIYLTATAASRAAIMTLNGTIAGFNFLNSTTNGTLDWRIGGGGTSATLTFGTGSAGAERMRIDSSGNVGIGTSSPAAKLDVAGPIKTLGYTVATLPAGVTGMRAYVTDALAPSFGVAVAGSGAITIPVFYDGANWIVA